MDAYSNPTTDFVPTTPDFDSDYESDENIEVTTKLEPPTYDDWTEKKVKAYGTIFTREINEKQCALSRTVILKEEYDSLPSDLNQIGNLSLIDIILAEFDLENDDEDEVHEEYTEVVMQIWRHFKELFRIVIDWVDVNDIYKTILKNDRAFLSEVAVYSQFKFEQFKDDYYLFVSIQKDLFLKDLNKALEYFE